MQLELEITVNGVDATLFAEVDYTVARGSPSYRTWDCPMGYPADPDELEVGEFTDVAVEFCGDALPGKVKDRGYDLESCLPSDWKVVGLPSEDEIIAACWEDAANNGGY